MSAASEIVRDRPDLSALFELAPGLCSLALLTEIRNDPAQLEPIRATRRGIFTGPGFGERDAHARMYLLAHAALHFALGHPRRAAIFARGRRNFMPALWTFAADAIVNDALQTVGSLRIPAGEVSFDDVIGLVPHARMLCVEGLYVALLDVLPKRKLEAVRPDIETDGVEDESDTDTPECWKRRVERAFGDHPLGYERLSRDLPETKTPWQYILRSYAARCLSRQNEIDHSRPHRRWCALAPGMAERGITYPVIPGYRLKPTPRIAVAVDTSGSISERLYAAFKSEIIGIMRASSATVRVITCDADVHEIADFSNPTKLLDATFHGGGGTSFDPAIAAAASFAPTLMIYLTDLEASVPAKPAFPMIWCVPSGCRLEAPFGKRIEIA